MDSCNSLPKLKKIFPGTEIAKIAEFISNGQNPAQLYDLALQNCKNIIQEQVPIESCSGTMESKLNFIDKKLLIGPVAFGYKQNVEVQYLPNLPPDHAMTIVGRKWDSDAKECSYLIRDSGGEYRVAGFTKHIGYQQLRWVHRSELLQAMKSPQAICTALAK